MLGNWCDCLLAASVQVVLVVIILKRIKRVILLNRTTKIRNNLGNNRQQAIVVLKKIEKQCPTFYVKAHEKSVQTSFSNMRQQVFSPGCCSSTDSTVRYKWKKNNRIPRFSFGNLPTIISCLIFSYVFSRRMANGFHPPSYAVFQFFSCFLLIIFSDCMLLQVLSSS